MLSRLRYGAGEDALIYRLLLGMTPAPLPWSLANTCSRRHERRKIAAALVVLFSFCLVELMPLDFRLPFSSSISLYIYLPCSP